MDATPPLTLRAPQPRLPPRPHPPEPRLPRPLAPQEALRQALLVPLKDSPRGATLTSLPPLSDLLSRSCKSGHVNKLFLN